MYDWPKHVKFYLHYQKEDLYEHARQLGLDDGATKDFVYSLYEVEFNGTVNENGVFTCYSVNGMPLIKHQEM